jgi:Putative restriction endonuclease
MTIVSAAPRRRHRPWRLSVDRYLRMIKAGILTRKDRVLLWKGQLVEKMTKGRPHVVVESYLDRALQRMVPDGWYVEHEAPTVLTQRDDTLPEPDLKVVRGRGKDYADPPTTRDVSLVIEVADSSLPDDRNEVLELFGAESIPVYWVANILDRRIEVYAEPTGPAVPVGYCVCTIFRPGNEVPVVLDGIEVGRIAVDEVFSNQEPRSASSTHVEA